MNAADRAFLQAAAEYLEKPSLLLRLTNVVGKPIEASLTLLPARARSLVAKATSAALAKALHVALRTIAPSGGQKTFAEAGRAARRNSLAHRAGTALTGAVGGFFGFAALGVELPLTTTLMLRSIAKIADDFGADLSDPHVRLECLTVFSLGAPTREDDAAESAYFSARLGMAELVKKAAASVGETFARGTAPELVRLLSRIGARFELVVTEKALAEALPVLGAATGAAINVAFSARFDAVARFHFGIRALEKKYGEGAVRAVYEQALR